MPTWVLSFRLFSFIMLKIALQLLFNSLKKKELSLCFCYLASLLFCRVLQGDSSSTNYDGGPEFAEVFVIVWIGAMVVTLNSKLLGGKMYVFLNAIISLVRNEHLFYRYVKIILNQFEAPVFLLTKLANLSIPRSLIFVKLRV